MIRSFGNKVAEALFHGLGGKEARSFPADLVKVAARKLDMVNSAHLLTDLRMPPNNHLELLKGDRKGQYSIRINRQWRVVFRWDGADAFDVSVVDYHSS